jgi:exonuclease III
MENYVRNLWGYQCFFSSYSSNSRGVAILLNNNFDCKVLSEKGDVDGNYLLLKLSLEGHEVLLCTVYGPNNDIPPQFFESIQAHIDDMQCMNIIWCGDFNLVLNPDLDCYNYKCVNNPKARNKVLELIESNGYVDPFRQLHENLGRYSWRKKISA